MTEKIHVLFLPRWYPHRYDPMPGLFIRYQAEAVSRYCNVAVLYVHADIHASNLYEIDIASENGVNVVRVYYSPATKYTLFAGFVRMYRFFRAHFLGMRALRSFKPDLLHVHVLTREGVFALWNKIRHGTPYVVTEHWSRYLPASDTFHGFFRKLVTRKVIRSAAAMITVSGKLRDAMQRLGLDHPDWHVVHNPVDTERFTPGGKRPVNDVKRFIHISCFEERPKNISGFLKAAQKLFEKRKDFEARLIGDGPEFKFWREKAEEMGILGSPVTFAGLKENSELVEEIRSADFLVLSSNYETFGTVVIECLACGIPVVATNVGIVPEVINAEDGIMIGPGDQQALEDAIEFMLDNFHTFDRQKIRDQVVPAFSMESIASRIEKIYSACLRK